MFIFHINQYCLHQNTNQNTSGTPQTVVQLASDNVEHTRTLLERVTVTVIMLVIYIQFEIYCNKAQGLKKNIGLLYTIQDKRKAFSDLSHKVILLF